MEGIDGSLGSKFITNTGHEVDFCLITLFRASLLGTPMAFSIAELIIAGLYSLDISQSFNSEKCFSLSSAKVQILTILRAREYGILLLTCAGWQELGKRY